MMNIQIKKYIKNAWMLCFFLIGTNVSSYSIDIGEVLTYQLQKQAVIFSCDNNAKVKLSIVSDDIIRVQVSTNGKFEASKMIELGFVKDNLDVVDFKLTESSNQYELTTVDLTIQIEKKKFRLKVFDKSGNLVVRNNKKLGMKSGNGNAIYFDMPADEHFFGFGFMRKTLDARGHKLTFKRDYR